MTLKNCIERIPSCGHEIIKNQTHIFHQVKELIQDKKITEIVVVASGSSMNAAKVTSHFVEKECGIRLTCIFPNMFVNDTKCLNPDALYVVISQGGSTKLVYDALQMIQKKQWLNLSITEKLDAPIAKKAICAIEMGSKNEEYVYRTIGYSTSVMTMCMVEMACAFYNGFINETKVKELNEDLVLALNHLPIIQRITEEYYVAHKFSLMKRNKIILAGANYLAEVANEADIKLMEMVPLFTRSFELEELIHGPQNAFDDNTIYFLLCDKRYDEKKVHDIAKFLKNEIGFCCIVGDSPLDKNDLNFEYKSHYFNMLESITVFQLIAYYMATDHGRDLSRGVNSSILNYIKKTL